MSKGDWPRPTDAKKFGKGWDAIFKPKPPKDDKPKPTR